MLLCLCVKKTEWQRDRWKYISVLCYKQEKLKKKKQQKTNISRSQPAQQKNIQIP